MVTTNLISSPIIDPSWGVFDIRIYQGGRMTPWQGRIVRVSPFGGETGHIVVYLSQASAAGSELSRTISQITIGFVVGCGRCIYIVSIVTNSIQFSDLGQRQAPASFFSLWPNTSPYFSAKSRNTARGRGGWNWIGCPGSQDKRRLLKRAPLGDGSATHLPSGELT